MPAFVFLSIVGLFGFFAFEPPGEITPQTEPSVIVAVVHEDAEGEDAWLRKEQGEVVTNAEDQAAVAEETAETFAAQEEVTPPEENLAVEPPSEPVSPTEATPSEEAASVTEETLDEAVAVVPPVEEVAAAVEEGAVEFTAEVPAMTPEEAIPVPVLVLEEGAGPVASVEEVPTQETTEQNLVEALQEAAE